MNKNRKRVTKNSKKVNSPTKPAIISAQPSQITTPPRRRFHINLAEIDLWQSVILFSTPLLFTTIVLFPILNGLHHLHPEATIIAAPIVTFIVFVSTVIATGIFSIKKINPFHPKKYKAKQAFYSATSGTLLSILLLVWAIPWPVPQSVSAMMVPGNWTGR